MFLTLLPKALSNLYNSKYGNRAFQPHLQRSLGKCYRLKYFRLKLRKDRELTQKTIHSEEQLLVVIPWARVIRLDKTHKHFSESFFNFQCLVRRPCLWILLLLVLNVYSISK